MDDADITQKRMEIEEELTKRGPYEIAAGIAGECDKCGEESPRLINGVCAPCRDKYKLP